MDETNQYRIANELLERLDAIIQRLEDINTNVTKLTLQEGIMASDLENAIAALTAQVAETTSVEQSAVTLIQQIAAQIAANANDSAAVTALALQLQQNTQSLADAISANTPAAPSA